MNAGYPIRGGVRFEINLKNSCPIVVLTSSKLETNVTQQFYPCYQQLIPISQPNAMHSQTCVAVERIRLLRRHPEVGLDARVALPQRAQHVHEGLRRLHNFRPFLLHIHAFSKNPHSHLPVTGRLTTPPCICTTAHVT